MAEISAAQVKDLRERTGAGMMDCKKALAEASGDSARAAEMLRERGLSKASKRAGRASSEGRVVALVAADGRAGALVELDCETDFVAKTDDFTTLGEALARVGRGEGARQRRGAAGLRRRRREAARRGEQRGHEARREPRRASARSSAVAGLRLRRGYVHAGGKLGVLVALESETRQAGGARARAQRRMHVAATSPASLSRDDLPKAVVDAERSVLTQAGAERASPRTSSRRWSRGASTSSSRKCPARAGPRDGSRQDREQSGAGGAARRSSASCASSSGKPARNDSGLPARPVEALRRGPRRRARLRDRSGTIRRPRARSARSTGSGSRSAS